QTNEILAQVGALVRSAKGPLAGLPVRKVLLWGTSATSAILVNYLPAHKIYKTPDMKNIFDGFMPTSNGATIKPVDVPMIQVPTQHEYGNIATAEQDSDKPGSPFRVYEVAGLAHLDARNNGARFNQSHCANPLTKFPNEAYMAVALSHLVQWVDKGTLPPKADRVLADFNVTNDGSLMLLDENGNARGGIRNPYVDVPVAKYTAVNTPTQAGLSSKAGAMGPALLCTLSVWETPIPAAKLKQLYGSKDAYVKKFEARLNELEKAGWSLPVYHDLILADAKAVNF
ncbi:MAG: alpha/beta hydrolase domain-containing protein, partial [Steroidobacteraceae bacterium]